MIAWWLVACMWSKRAVVEDPVEEHLARGDALYAERLKPQALMEAREAYLVALSIDPDHVGALERLTRTWLVEGLTTESSDALATARELGLRCLMALPELGHMEHEALDGLSERALSVVPQDGIGCLTLATTAWCRWLWARGPQGVSVDHETVVRMAKRAVELDGNYDRGAPYTALGLAHSLGFGPAVPDWRSATQALREAQRLAPDRLTVHVDYATYVLGPQGDKEAWTSKLNGVVTATPQGPDILENTTAKTRAQEALEGGLPVWPWTAREP